MRRAALATIATSTCWVEVHAEVAAFASATTPEDQLMLDVDGWAAPIVNAGAHSVIVAVAHPERAGKARQVARRKRGRCSWYER